MQDRLTQAASRIIENYRQTGFDPAESTDNAVMLAVDYLAKADPQNTPSPAVFVSADRPISTERGVCGCPRCPKCRQSLGNHLVGDDFICVNCKTYFRFQPPATPPETSNSCPHPENDGKHMWCEGEFDDATGRYDTCRCGATRPPETSGERCPGCDGTHVPIATSDDWTCGSIRRNGEFIQSIGCEVKSLRQQLAAVTQERDAANKGWGEACARATGFFSRLGERGLELDAAIERAEKAEADNAAYVAGCDVDHEIRSGVPVLKGTRFTLSQLLIQLVESETFRGEVESFDLDPAAAREAMEKLAKALEQPHPGAALLKRVASLERNVSELQDIEVHLDGVIREARASLGLSYSGNEGHQDLLRAIRAATSRADRAENELSALKAEIGDPDDVEPDVIE